jgi:hypothetical protein
MIRDQELDQLEKQRQTDSDWVIARLNLQSILNSYGEVKVVGAKALGLMVAKDIDISVLVDTVRVKDWQKLVGKLMETPYVRNISAIDYYNYDEQNRYDPTNGQRYSLYVSINNIVGPEEDKFDTWECQIHLIDRAQFDESKVTEVKNKLPPEKRLTILRIKHWTDQLNKILMSKTNNNFKIYSPSIYHAVLENNEETVTSFVENYTTTIPERFKETFQLALDQIENK